MASIKVKYRASAADSHDGAIYYQIIHDRKVRQLSTQFRIRPNEWDETRSMVITRPASERKPLILSIREQISHDVDRLARIVRRFDSAGVVFTAEDVADEFKRSLSRDTLSNFMERLIAQLKHNGKERTSETYAAALSSFRSFLRCYYRHNPVTGSDDIMLDCISAEIMEAYEAWHRHRGNTPNTISFYTRILRAVYNRAVEDDIIADKKPFRRVYTGIDKTVKRAIPLDAVRRLRNLDLSLSRPLDFARDMFMMSFYLRGISFIDLAFLKKSDLRNGILSYRRRKTGQKLTIRWTAEMQELLEKYDETPTEYLMPIITSHGIKPRCTYRNKGYSINHNLKTIAGMIGIDIPLTLYVARHSWASAAKSKGIPLSVISEGMGHDSEATTRIYLASLEGSVVDRANSIILSSL